MDRILPRNAPDLPAGDLSGSLDVSTLSLLKRRLLVLGTRWPASARPLSTFWHDALSPTWWGSSDLFDFTAARNVLARPANSSFIILTEVKASALVSSHKRHGHRGEHQLNVIEVMMTRVR
jgi:hypothetical protein